jgi:uncharacterized repeat protein (TIGR03987 family)
MCLALLFYSVGVWGEKIQHRLKAWHLVMFWAGLVFDTTGTTIMSKIAKDGFVLNFHGIVGLLAILLMIFHAFWATVVLKQSNEKSLQNFHKFSIIVWTIWLVPFFSGMIFAMLK